jgi:hypothetical protein
MNKKLWDMIEQAAKETNNDPNGEYNLDLMTRFDELARQDEREQCAKDYLEDCVRAVEKEREESAKHYLRIMRDAVEQAILKEKNRCIKIIENYQIHVGGSSAGEIACEMTYSSLRDIRDKIRGVEE